MDWEEVAYDSVRHVVIYALGWVTGYCLTSLWYRWKDRVKS